MLCEPVGLILLTAKPPTDFNFEDIIEVLFYPLKSTLYTDTVEYIVAIDVHPVNV